MLSNALGSTVFFVCKYRLSDVSSNLFYIIKLSNNLVLRGKYRGLGNEQGVRVALVLQASSSSPPYSPSLHPKTDIHVATIRHDKIAHTDMIPTLRGMLSLGTTQWQQLLNQTLFRRTSYSSLCSRPSWLATPNLQADRHCLLASRVWYGTEAKTSVVSYNNYTES